MAVTHPGAESASVSFTDLFRNPRGVAARVATAGRLRLTLQDTPDLVLTTASVAEIAEKNLTTASRLFLALLRQKGGAKALQEAVPEVFPWTRHLDAREARAFTLELLESLSDAAELSAGDGVRRAVVSWRAVARGKAERRAGGGRSARAADRPAEGGKTCADRPA
ncbi:hypothetical protein [Streptomyces sp. BBFR102]|uniref:hypothetical protein n=1 Tax=Streptomyces sp. BBFR102 TaxID=3448171 RepID=UPI003F52BE0A